MKVLWTSFTLCLISLCAVAQKPITGQASLESVTVYRAGAELNHKARVTLPKGKSELVISNVANVLDENSLRLAAGTNVTIMSATFERDFLKEENKSPAYLKLEDSLKVANRELTKTRIMRTSEENTLTLLDKNQSLHGTTGTTSVAELIRLADYYKAKQLELRNNIASLLEKEAVQLKQVTKIQQQLTELNADPDKNGGQLVLQVMADNAATADISISYLTPNAYWTVYYDLRADKTTEPLKIIYKANVMQSTGIDWKKVKLTLSTGNPSQNGTAPVLSTWFLRYAQDYQLRESVVIRGYQNRIQTLDKRVAPPPAAPKEEETSGSLADFTSVNENQLSATFDIDIPYDIAPTGKQHSVTLKEYTLPARYKYYAVPKADPDAFLMAEITDYEKFNFLPGEANIIFENMYVGKSFIDPNATTDTLNLSVGRDKKVVVKKEKITDVAAGVKFLGSQKRQTFTYEIRVRNGKKEPVDMLLKDQYPVSTDKNMEVELQESSDAAVNTETGVLTWKLNIAPGETKKVRLSYTVKYPKDKVIANL